MKAKLIILIAALGFVGCSNSSQPNIELVQDMHDQPFVKAQEYDESSPNGIGMRVPPENTVPQGFRPYPYGTDIDKAKSNPNPIAGQTGEDVLMAGQKYYETHCAVCHGSNGEGGLTGNSVGDKMALKPPSLLSDKVRGLTDGHLYHIITKGQGVMGPYESHVPQAYRWQVVNYIRELQKRAK